MTRRRGPRIGDVVEIEWLDSEHIALGWRPRREYLEAATAPQAYRTAGYWLSDRGGHVLVALSVDPANGQVTHAMAIPSPAVARITVLGRARRRTRRALR